MRRAGAKDYAKYSKEIIKITRKPVSCEVFADDIKNMILQGKKISKWGKNVYVKVPVINSKGKFMGKVIKSLNNRKIKLNITAVYTAKQTKQILKAINRKTKVIISIFAGRAGDVGKDPIPIIKNGIPKDMSWAEPYDGLFKRVKVLPFDKHLAMPESFVYKEPLIL